MDKIKFSSGEKRLDAVTKEFKLMNNDNRHFYNADGIISHTESGIEIGILNTTVPLLQHNDPKETQDYIKAGYGLVAMLHIVGRKYHYGNFEIFKRVSSFFVQATLEVPMDPKTSEEKLRALIDLFWLLKKSIEESYQAV
ncbi:unnamed protein product [Rhizopus stolonifer]